MGARRRDFDPAQGDFVQLYAGLHPQGADRAAFARDFEKRLDSADELCRNGIVRKRPR